MNQNVLQLFKIIFRVLFYQTMNVFSQVLSECETASVMFHC